MLEDDDCTIIVSSEDEETIEEKPVNSEGKENKSSEVKPCRYIIWQNLSRVARQFFWYLDNWINHIQ